MEYDIIGDIHGYARELECLLDKLGYSTDGTEHPEGRQLLFLGDFIDRGPENRRTIEIVQTLVQSGLASAVMGNHEYNAICYHTRSEGGDKEFLREHSEKNTGQHQKFLDDYPDREEREQVIRWFQRLPLYLDLGELRVVHACWNQEAICFVNEHYNNQLNQDFLLRSVDKNTNEYRVIETLLKGPERSLKPGLFFHDTDGNRRQSFRLKWWKQKLNTLGESAILPPDHSLTSSLNDPLSLHCGDQAVTPYPGDAPPVLFGHYAALPVEESFTHNTACLDYNIIKGKQLAALRWKKDINDRLLMEMEVVTVDFMEPI